MKHKRAFTLIELLIVIAVVVILASLVIISLGEARRAANETKIKAEASQLKRALEMEELMNPDGMETAIAELLESYDYIDNYKYSEANNSFCFDYLINSVSWCTDKKNTSVLGFCYKETGEKEGSCEEDCSVLSLGYLCGGGKIADISNGNTLIAALDNISTGYQWGCQGQPVPLTTSTTDGATNTTVIIDFHSDWSDPWEWLDSEETLACNALNNGEVAARLCNNKTTSGYTDWYLPAQDELLVLYNRKDIIGEFANSNYWSSSTFNNSSFARAVNFNTGSELNTNRYNSYYVRCVRRQ
jgi:prepilin-type N-terminal cleavage/methylation domain-containing protein